MCYFIIFFLENLLAFSLDRIDINEIIEITINLVQLVALLVSWVQHE